VIPRSSSICFRAEIEHLVSEAFDPRETPRVVAQAYISKSENLEKERFDLVPRVMAWMRCSASWVARSNCVASLLCCIFTLWLERTGEAVFSLIPPKAITSSIFLDLADGVGGEEGVAAIHGVPLMSTAPFLHPADEVAGDF
jgi:hypothetical protein